MCVQGIIDWAGTETDWFTDCIGSIIPWCVQSGNKNYELIQAL